MTDRSQDPRSLRTVATLRAALRTALSDRSLDEINVSELCRIAGVRRTTFYTHYPSVSGLLTEMLTAEIDELLDVPVGLDQSVSEISAEFQKTLVEAFGLVTRDRPLFRAGLESSVGAPLRRALLRMFADRLEIAIGVWRRLGVEVPTDVTVAIAFSAGGLCTSVEAWALSCDTDSVAWADAVRDQMPPWWPRYA
ncbi:TetR/AcrR family transcriptional regulator [Frondihabitans cladoniiphilus]|uniref:HTH tetR-type domain-containing protein n=1 Tax=Frondihabitans cladoniiphilus TaxID=715785 RepID=A0ABP8VJM2_9MICO